MHPAVPFVAACGFLSALLPAQLRRTVVVSGLDEPLYATAPAGDDRLFILEKGGRIQLFENGILTQTPFLDISSRVLEDAEAGLVGLAFHPQYEQNGYFFVNYSERNTRATIIERFSVSATDPNVADVTSGTVILGPIDQPTNVHNSGCLQFGPDGYLYIGMGDGGFPADAICQAQNPLSLLGKILRIDVDNPVTHIPPDNPYVADPDTCDEIWIRGFRNPWRFSFDRLTGDMYLGDVGQSTREEINFLPASSTGGENYGWNTMEGSLCFSPGACVPGLPPCNGPGLTHPIYQYDRGNLTACEGAAIGGYVYRGCEVPGLAGTYFFGDYCSGRISSFRYENGQIIDFQDRTDELGGPIVLLNSFGEDGHGEVLMVSLAGAVYKIEGTATTPASFSTFGAGCPGSVGVPTLDADSELLPWIGETFTIELGSLPGSPLNSAFGVLGFSKDLWGSVPLPQELSLIGFPGCTQFVSAEFVFPLVNTGGQATWDIPLPCQPRLIGANFYVQALVLDFGAPGNAILSNAGQGVVGVPGKQRVTPLGPTEVQTVPRARR